ncbi:hypothetical protein [Phenylobacterium sp.]|uniref:hypothetical protein n=1 Tax=Phenylobacterium sp. TaxID=1871053 RepID=UPI002BDED46D|nr:hypothetical protein [Phenylobacterium sp.]HVI31015.1 hypothetical protein [Phenylobacterium sp.]
MAGVDVHGRGGDGDLTAVGHRVAGVHRQVQQRHLELVGVSPGGGQIRRQVQQDLNAGT